MKNKKFFLILFSLMLILFFYISVIKENLLFSYEEYTFLSQIKNSNQSYSNFLYPLIKIIPLIFFIATIILLLIFEKKFNLENFTFFVILSPPFIFTYLFFNNFFMPFFIFLLAILFLINEKYFFAFTFFIISIILNPYFFYIIIFSLAIFYSINEKKFLFPFIIILFISLLFSILKIRNSFNILSDFGTNGLSIFLIILSFIGLIYHIKNTKNKNPLVYISIIFLYLISQYELYFLVFLTLFLSFFASYAYKLINESEWQSTNLKSFVLLLILCGLLFSSLSFLNNIKKDLLLREEILAYEWLSNYNKNNNIINKNNTNESVVLNHYKTGFLLEFYNLKPYLDLNYYISGKRLKIEQQESIIKSRNLKNILNFLRDNKIKYIFIDTNLKNKIGKNDDDGFLLVLKNSIYFKKIYTYKDVIIFEFLENNNIN